eukprot:scaffold13983_cov125-Isochrysis_galbana.AAC.2
MDPSSRDSPSRSRTRGMRTAPASVDSNGSPNASRSPQPESDSARRRATRPATYSSCLPAVRSASARAASSA